MNEGDEHGIETSATRPAPVGDAPEPCRAAFEAHHDRLLLYTWRLIGDVERARDVVQEAFARLVVEQRRGGLNGSLAPWLYAVCRNQALDVRRKERRMKLMIEPDQAIDTASSGVDPAMQAEQSDTASRVLKLLARLPENQREVIRLKFQAGLTYRQIGEVTGLSESNVGFLMHTGLKTLRENLNS